MSDTNDGPRVLIVTVRFPSAIQPWLLNQIAQIFRHSGSVEIVARTGDEGAPPELVDELGLLEHTHYFSVSSPGGALKELLSILSPGPKGRAARRGVRRLFASSWRPTGPRAWLKTLARGSILDLPRIDVVHSHSLRYAYEYLHVARIHDIPMILSFHGYATAGVGLLSKPKRTELFSTIDAALVNTEFAAEQLTRIGCSRDKIRILPQGIRLDEWEYRPQPPPESGPVRLLSVGRLQPEKGLRYAIDAVDILLDRGYDVDYTMVGSGPEEASLRDRIESLGRGDRIRLAGRVYGESLRDLYRDSHVFILPSVANRVDDPAEAVEGAAGAETQGVVLQEAQASGTIVTAARVGGIPECVDEGVSAFLFPERDAGAIADSVAGVLDQPARWREWQDAARVWVEERFDIDVLGDRLLELYATMRAERQNRVERP